MKRLLVLIGVRQPGGGLTELKSIAKCLKDMRDWALSQQISRSDIKIFTDIPELIEPGDPAALSVNDIYNWIDQRAQEAVPADQLVIYFSGHGMQAGGAALWLLPKAPEKIWEAIDVETTRTLANYSRFQHIVFIGDCCGTVAGNAQYDFVKGSSILKNIPRALRNRQRVVDYLRAAKPDDPSLEVIIDGVSVSPYTVELVRSLGGDPASLLESRDPETPVPLVLRVERLARQLRTAVNAFLMAHHIKPVGDPEAAVLSRTEWIALFPSLPARPQPPATLSPPGGIPGDIPPDSFFSIAGGTRSVRTLTGVTSPNSSAGPAAGFPSGLDRELVEVAAGRLPEIRAVDWSSGIPDGYHYETSCGFFVTAGAVRSAAARPSVEVNVLGPQEVRANPEAVELVSIEFVGGRGIMVPAIPGQIGFVHLENGRMVSLAYEPSGHRDVAEASAARRDFQSKSRRVRQLRDVLLEVVTGGDLAFTDIDPRTVFQVVRDAAYGGQVDFSTLLYLAYAAHASQYSKPAILNLAGYMQGLFGCVPYDLQVLLALAGIVTPHNLLFVPPFPMLTQGWSLLRATDQQVPESLAPLAEYSLNAAWTQFNAKGVELCRSYLAELTSSGTSGMSGTPLVVEPSLPATVLEGPIYHPTVWFREFGVDSVEEEERPGNLTSEA